jgi:hypothetical protein
MSGLHLADGLGLAAAADFSEYRRCPRLQFGGANRHPSSIEEGIALGEPKALS